MYLPARPFRVATAAAAGLLAVLLGVGHAQASDRWEEAGSGAVAILPVPFRANVIQGGSLVCAEQRWTLRLRTEKRLGAAGPASLELLVDGRRHPSEAHQGPTLVDIPVDLETLERLRKGVSLVVRLGSEAEAPNATFSLRNSQKTIDAIAPRCSPVNMDGYDHVALVEGNAEAALAEPLLKDEIRLFRQATTASPRIAAARIDRGEGRSLLFASLCGSTWYYGRSGCTLFGFARESEAADWRQVYHSEGMSLYLDAASGQNGWPGLATLQAGGTEPMRWRWDGNVYELGSSAYAAEDLKGSIVTP